MKILVAYASRHGATAGIAKRVAESLALRSLDATAMDVNDVHDLDEYDAVVLGSAASMSRWLEDARRFAARHHRALAAKRVWLFSSGPTGTDLVDDEGRDIFEVSRPKDMIELDTSLAAEGTKVFSALTGDQRDWVAIDEWADSIASALHPG